ncbi:MAG: methyltransferase domain-containing protein [Chloroflexi bacterium]|nr:methyltransferase domain-containing protein [Chloroflexota bacterium]
MRIRAAFHREYAEQDVDFYAWVVDHVPWQGGEHVLDVGCGIGLYVPYYLRHTSHLVGVDISPAMLQTLRESVSFPGALLVARAEALPFPPNTFHVVFANHVLFFVDDVERALTEAHRVLRPGGWFVAATYTEESLAQVYRVHARALHRIGRMPTRARHLRFPLETGAEVVQRVFPSVQKDRLPNAFLFPSVEVAMRYYLSGPVREVVGPPLSPAEREALLAEVRTRIAREIHRHGVWRVSKDAGVILARKEEGVTIKGGDLEDEVGLDRRGL